MHVAGGPLLYLPKLCMCMRMSRRVSTLLYTYLLTRQRTLVGTLCIGVCRVSANTNSLTNRFDICLERRLGVSDREHIDGANNAKPYGQRIYSR